MKLPQNHPLRCELHNEIHARPPQEIRAPARISYMALLSPQSNAEQEREHVASLCRQMGAQAPESIGNHYIADFGAFRLKWERHTEFARYKIIAEGSDNAFSEPAIGLLPEEWVVGIPGELFMATNVALTDPPAELSYDAIARDYFSGRVLVGSAVAGGSGIALTDFHISEDGFGRLIIFNRDMTPRQTGRTVQRLLEIDTYRMMALLAFPVAIKLRPFLSDSEKDLAQVTRLMTSEARDDPALLDRLVQLEAAIERRYADHHSRFNAADAYSELVRQRIADLREDRLQGLQTFGEFMGRRLAPAMSTCRAVSRGIDTLAERVERSTQLLSTRVGLAREKQNQQLLETMARRAKLQLRLQQTVEGLSVAAISYYVVGLVAYAAKALKAGGAPVDPNLAAGLALPVVVLLATFGVRHIRKRVTQGRDGGHDET